MSPRDALRAATRAVWRCPACAARSDRIVRLTATEAALTEQIHLNGRLAADGARQDARIAELETKLAAVETRVKELKAREATLSGVIVTVLWQRGRVAHEARKLSAVTGPVEVGGGEAA